MHLALDCRILDSGLYFASLANVADVTVVASLAAVASLASAASFPSPFPSASLGSVCAFATSVPCPDCILDSGLYSGLFDGLWSG